jgi:hypothetical protein
MSKILPASIIIFWLIMTGLYIKKEILPQLPYLDEPSYELALKYQSQLGTARMGVYFLNQKIGTSSNTITKTLNGYYEIIHETSIKLPGFIPDIKANTLTINGQTIILPSYQLKSFQYSIVMGTLPYTVSGLVSKGKLLLTTSYLGTLEHREMPFNPRATTSAGLSPFITMPYLAVGKEWAINMVNPMTMQIETTKARVESKIIPEWWQGKGPAPEVFEVVLDYKTFQPKAWITPDGQILKEEGLIPGLYLLKE